MDNAKKKLRELAAEVEKIKDEMEEPSFRMGVKHLEKLVRWKTRKDDEKLPSKKKGGPPAEMGRNQRAGVAPHQPV